jgi:hypothetical protein
MSLPFASVPNQWWFSSVGGIRMRSQYTASTGCGPQIGITIDMTASTMMIQKLTIAARLMENR